jgi:hypothetical protein
MSTITAAPPSSLRSWITGCLMAILAFGACWAGAIVYWRSRDGDPGAGELLFYLFLLPGALLAAALLIRKRLAEPGKPAAPAPGRTSAAALLQPVVAQPLAVLATSLRSPHGASVAELAAALTGKQARPSLDASLVDASGYPLLTARCTGADDAAIQEAIAAWLAANDLPCALRDEDWRALVIATQVTQELTGLAVAALMGDRTLQVAPCLPSAWTASQRYAAGLWLQHTVGQAGWPVDQVAIVTPADTDLFDPVPAALLADLSARAAREQVACMLIACASHLGDDTVQLWSANDTLFTSTQPLGNVPGEGAVGLLLTNPREANAIALVDPLHTARRDTSADSARGAIPTTLADLAKRAGDPAALSMIVADTGPRPSRMLELMGFAGTAAPQLDDDKEVIAFGHASGACGAAQALTALALAAHYAGERMAPVLWLSNEDAFQRCAAEVRPAMPSQEALIKVYQE